jgi:hypothetical protein
MKPPELTTRHPGGFDTQRAGSSRFFELPRLLGV